MKANCKVTLHIASPVMAICLLAAGGKSPAFGQTNHSARAATPPVARVAHPAPNAAAAAVAAPAASAASDSDAVGPVDGKTQQSLQHLVSAQLSAFARNDFAGALTYSVPEFRQSWSADSFRQMIRSGYAPLMDYRKATFAPARRLADSAFMPVMITSGDGQSVAYMYVFRHIQSHAGIGTTAYKKGAPHGAAGTWLIDNVSPLDPDLAPLPALPSVPSSNRHSTGEPDHDVLIREA